MPAAVGVRIAKAVNPTAEIAKLIVRPAVTINQTPPPLSILPVHSIEMAASSSPSGKHIVIDGVHYTSIPFPHTTSHAKLLSAIHRLAHGSKWRIHEENTFQKAWMVRGWGLAKTKPTHMLDTFNTVRRSIELIYIAERNAAAHHKYLLVPTEMLLHAPDTAVEQFRDDIHLAHHSGGARRTRRRSHKGRRAHTRRR